MHLVFVHGWAFGADLWQPVIRELDFRVKISCVDLGFFSNPHNHDVLQQNAVYIGHSMGAMWILKNAAPHMKGLVSICGFDCFKAHVEPRQLLAMQRGVERNLSRQLKMFWTACGVPDYGTKGEADQSALHEGLKQLSDWDLSDELTKYSGPRLILASEDDQIVPKQMSCDIWGGDNIHWSKDGGHVLPFTKPKWIANKLTEFVNEIEA